ncbi:dTMP kinase [Candidatus Bathyarchaeota archaeon]|nr:dTMP kinase [Candidatus Bathyarchaeota archaeon]
MKGLFIVIEGIDGAGKTLQSKLLQKELVKKGFKAVYTAEPSKSFIGKILRETSLKGIKLNPEVEALLFAADRFQHINLEVLPSLKKGEIIICDRYLYASLAYQGAQGVDLNWIKTINKFSIKPDLAIYLDVPVEVGLTRITKRKKTVFEKIEIEEKVREVYLKLVEEKELILIDANKPIKEVNKEIVDLIFKTLLK